MDFFGSVLEAKKEERLKVIRVLKKLAIMTEDDEKAIECICNFLGFLEGKDTTNYDDFIRLILDNSITRYTLGEPQYLEYLKNINGIEEVEFCDKHVKIHLSNGKKIIFSSLSQYLGNYLREEDIKELESYQGLNACHKGSIFTSMWSPDKNEVVTGYADRFGQYLHSWVEAKTASNREVVMDYTLNAVMNKDGYYYIKGIDEPINRIQDWQIKQDVNNNVFGVMEKLDLGDKEYVVFRDEILKDIKRFLENDASR